jgi:cob(I)alamin adenosyltransferase
MGHRLSKIYTRTGDDGSTGLGDGSRIDKDSHRVEAYGTIDELNCTIGMILAEDAPDQTVRTQLGNIQHDLFDLGGELCVPGQCVIDQSFVQRLERELDDMNAELPPLKEFILPGGGLSGSTLHLARAICRKTERRLVTLIGSGVQRELKDEMIYLNRLGDLIFVMARVVNLQTGSTETNWSVTR